LTSQSKVKPEKKTSLRDRTAIDASRKFIPAESGLSHASSNSGTARSDGERTQPGGSSPNLPQYGAYDDEAWGEHYKGIDGVRQFYEQLMKALPDLEIEMVRRHVTADAVMLEVIIRGTQVGEWRGLPATGRRVEVPLCGVYTFCSDNRLAGERIYYDRATVLQQLGVFHDPQSVVGQLCTLATHPVTIARALARKVLRS
jgi:steroid delta-isomerase-like uncharacterized protein